MIKENSIFENRRILLITAVIIGIAIAFWSTSRYPTLQGKADMTGIIQLEDTLTHEAFLHVPEDASLAKKVVLTTINWAWTNRQGMTFAILIASAFMTLFKYLPKYRSRNRFMNSVYGLATGTPLGVCVNCVAPIAKAMYEGGRSLHTALATMFSSPTLNIIVVTMLFSLFPFYIAAIKLAVTFFLILVVVPFLAPNDSAQEENMVCAIPGLGEPSFKGESWAMALFAIIKDYWNSFAYIVLRTVPLMFVAGFLGAIVSHVWDPNTLIGSEPSIFMVLAMGIFGTFLPMPIAFDVMVAQSLYAGNVPIVIVVTLLFTLGTFSIYSFFIIWRTFSLKLALLLYMIVTVLGVSAGYIAQGLADYKAERWEQQYTQEVLQDPRLSQPVAKKMDSATAGDVTLKGVLVTDNLVSEEVFSRGNVSITRTPFNSPIVEGELPFTKIEGKQLGITAVNEINARNFIEPFFLGRGLASGDFNNDGWVDLLVAETGAIELYQNINGERFEKVQFDVPVLRDKEVIFVAMVDMNRDGWLDFYASTFGAGTYLIFNPFGDSVAEQVIDTHDHEAVLTMSVTMGDINQDGWLDIFHGNWNGGELTANPGDMAKNVLLVNRNMKFSSIVLPELEREVEGNTLTSLLSDINNDGKLDLMVGNDFEIPDRFYINIDGTSFRQIGAEERMFPGSPLLNMSIDTADYDNDLTMDIYMTGGSWTETPQAERAAARYKDSQFCERIQDPEKRRNCVKIWMLSRITLVKDFKECEEMRPIFGDEIVRDCLVSERVHAIKWDLSQCEKVPQHYELYYILCQAVKEAPVRKVLENSSFVEQLPVKNVLLQNNGEHIFEDVSELKSVQYGAWSWGGKFGDLDNDGWQDIYVANGAVYAAFVGPTTHSPNMFFHNRDGRRFSIKHVSYGLDDFDHSSAFTYFDIDNDGDLDIIGNTTHGGLKVYKNNQTLNKAISFEFDDHVGNRDCIGCRIYLQYNNGMQQMRELKAGGGFLSFDAPYAHFGLGELEQVEQVSVVWSDGERTDFEQPLEAGHKYMITRKGRRM